MNSKAISLSKATSLAVLTALVLQGCSLAPKYKQPELPVAASWPQGEAYSAAYAEGLAAELGWRDFIRDPMLKELIELSLQNNRDLRVAALNVEAFQALYRIQRSDLLPSLDAQGEAARQRVPGDLSPSGMAAISSQYTIGAAAAYELDFFGRVRNLSEQALQEYLSTREAQRSVHIGLVASVAQAYLTWQADRSLLELARDTLETYEETLRLMRASYEAGVASELELRQAATAVDDTRAQIQRYVRQLAQDQNALRQLTGGQLPSDVPPPLDLQGEVLEAVPVGLSSEVLRYRPDIRAAEHRLIGAHANIGAARAAFFPSITLTAGGGTASAAMDGLFQGGSGVWSFVPRITVPIFNAGRLSANLDYAEIQKDIRVAEYEGAIQTAFREVADSLAALGTYEKQLDAQRDLVSNTARYASLAQQRYDEGVDSYLTVLDAQRLLFSSQQQLIRDRLAQLSSQITLYRALGGGWNADTSQQ